MPEIPQNHEQTTNNEKLERRISNLQKEISEHKKSLPNEEQGESKFTLNPKDQEKITEDVDKKLDTEIKKKQINMIKDAFTSSQNNPDKNYPS